MIVALNHSRLKTAPKSGRGKAAGLAGSHQVLKFLARDRESEPDGLPSLSRVVEACFRA